MRLVNNKTPVRAANIKAVAPLIASVKYNTATMTADRALAVRSVLLIFDFIVVRGLCLLKYRDMYVGFLLYMLFYLLIVVGLPICRP